VTAPYNAVVVILCPRLACHFCVTPVGRRRPGWSFPGVQQLKSIADRMKLGWTKETVKVTDAHPVGDAVWAIGEYTLIGSGQNSGKQTGGPWVQVLTPEAARGTCAC
jgi:hypothetical protein